MLKRLYIHNYKCLVNFEFKMDEDYPHSALLIGKNGAGKSSIAEVLEILRRIGWGHSNLLPLHGELGQEVQPLVSLEHFAFGNTGQPMCFELDVELGGRLCKYKLGIELTPLKNTALRIAHEELFVDGNFRFSREQTKVNFSQNQTTPYTYDWNSVYLPGFSERDPKYEKTVNAFKFWLKQMLILAPIPRTMRAQLRSKSLYLQNDAANITDWRAGLFERNPDAYVDVKNRYLKSVFPDFDGFRNEPDEFGAQYLTVLFKNNNDDTKTMIRFDHLSDGEKCVFLAAFVMMASTMGDSVFCFWDEPDNYLALSEVELLIATLKSNFSKRGQIFVTTHNPETLAGYAEDNTYIIYRENHLSHTRSPKTVAQWREEQGFTGNLVAAWALGDIDA